MIQSCRIQDERQSHRDVILIGAKRKNQATFHAPETELLQGFVARLRFTPAGKPFCYFALSAKKPTNSAYQEKLITLGDHLRKKRLDLGLFQKDVAVAIGVGTMTICKWE